MGPVNRWFALKLLTQSLMLMRPVLGSGIRFSVYNSSYGFDVRVNTKNKRKKETL